MTINSPSGSPEGTPTHAPVSGAAKPRKYRGHVLAGPFTICTDAICRTNPGDGGYAAIIRHEDGTEQAVSGGGTNTTNNRQHLLAVLVGLEALPGPSNVRFCEDSDYVRVCMRDQLRRRVAEGWRGKDGRPIANADLWHRLAEAAAPHRIKWCCCASRTEMDMRDRARKLADDARRRVTG
jgi:ribonuclease HI